MFYPCKYLNNIKVLFIITLDNPFLDRLLLCCLFYEWQCFKRRPNWFIKLINVYLFTNQILLMIIVLIIRRTQYYQQSKCNGFKLSFVEFDTNQKQVLDVWYILSEIWKKFPDMSCNHDYCDMMLSTIRWKTICHRTQHFIFY